MKVAALGLLAVALSACATTPVVVQKAGDAADEALMTGRNAFCSQRFSLRAYKEFAKTTGKTPQEVIDWCNWDQSILPFLESADR